MSEGVHARGRDYVRGKDTCDRGEGGTHVTGEGHVSGVEYVCTHTTTLIHVSGIERYIQ